MPRSDDPSQEEVLSDCVRFLATIGARVLTESGPLALTPLGLVGDHRVLATIERTGVP
jgi:hypothetical protein